jgi:hypothetical protein
MKLTFLELPQVSAQWDAFIRPGLLDVKKRCGSSCHWKADDIYHDVMAKRAAVYTFADETGFCVLQRLDSAFEVVLFVWAIWAPAGTMLSRKQDFIDGLDELAREVKANRIRMFSPRDGHIGMKLFVPVSTIYEREVT